MVTSILIYLQTWFADIRYISTGTNPLLQIYDANSCEVWIRHKSGPSMGCCKPSCSFIFLRLCIIIQEPDTQYWKYSDTRVPANNFVKTILYKLTITAWWILYLPVCVCAVKFASHLAWSIESVVINALKMTHTAIDTVTLTHKLTKWWRRKGVTSAFCEEEKTRRFLVCRNSAI